MQRYMRIYETVDLDAIRHNMEAMKANLSEGTVVIGVVKADGYGHGSVPVARAIAPYVWGYGTATLEEGIILRKHGIEAPILILGASWRNGYEAMLSYGIRPTVFRYSDAAYLSELAVKANLTAAIHIAVDTGMSRIGFGVTAEAAAETVRISRLPGIRIEGVFTHFARADEEDKGATDGQIRQFKAFAAMLSEKGVKIPLLHCSNSAGILDMKRANFNAVRAGISIYGVYPSAQVGREAVRLLPAMELKSTVTFVKTVPSGTPVSYGGTFTAVSDTAVATVAAGYGDGYPRSLSGRGQVLIRGARAPVLGRVCMDQLMVDVTRIPGVSEGDEVTLIGKDGEEEITVEELAFLGGGFHYELLCGIGKRVPRVYLEGGSAVGVKDYFDDAFRDFGKMT